MSDPTADAEFIDPQALRQRISDGAPLIIIDVRSVGEFAERHVDGAINIPTDELAGRMDTIPTQAQIVAVCTHGGKRSCGAASLLRSAGRADVVVLRGGIHGWFDNPA